MQFQMNGDKNIDVLFVGSPADVVVITDELSGSVPVCIEDVPELIEILQTIVKENAQ